MTWLLVGLAVLTWPTRSPAADRLVALRVAGRLAPVGSRPATAVGVVVEAARALTDRLASVATTGLVLGAGALALATVPLAGVVPAAAVGAVGLVAGIGVRSTVRAAGARRRRAQALTAARTVRAEVGAGIAPSAALVAAAVAAPLHASALTAAAAQVRDGADAGAVLRGRPELVGLGHAFRVSAESGAAMGVVLDAVVRDLEDVRDREDAVTTALASPRASAGLLAGLPVVGLALGIAMGANPVDVLFGSGVGRVVGSVGVVLDCVGLAWTMRIGSRARDAPGRGGG